MCRARISRDQQYERAVEALLDAARATAT